MLCRKCAVYMLRYDKTLKVRDKNFIQVQDIATGWTVKARLYQAF